jgi:hypothetical protein
MGQLDQERGMGGNGGAKPSHNCVTQALYCGHCHCLVHLTYGICISCFNDKKSSCCNEINLEVHSVCISL